MQIQLLRHATFVIDMKNTKLLVDPMLSPAEAMDPFPNTVNQWRNPLVDLPLTEPQLQQLLSQVQSVLVTHLHRDHWDSRAKEILPKQVPIFCQREDEFSLRVAGFSLVYPVQTKVEWQEIEIYRTRARHGTGEVEEKMGVVSGFVLKAKKEPTLYITGDTIWCFEVKEALQTYRPEVVVVYAGEASFLTGGRITMNTDDILQVCRESRKAKVIVIHMEAVNHCLLTRAQLRKRLEDQKFTQQVKIPKDGEVIKI